MQAGVVGTRYFEDTVRKIGLYQKIRIAGQPGKCKPTNIQLVHFPPKVVRGNYWQRRLSHKSHDGIINLHEDLAE